MNEATLQSLAKKWEEAGTRCGEKGRESDDEWQDGDKWRERRAVYFECAAELRATLTENNKQPNPNKP